MKEKNKKEKKSFKELWSNPISKSLIKLGIYGIFFIIIYIFIIIGNAKNPNAKRAYNNLSSTTTTTTKKMSYIEMKKNLINNEQKIIYTINDYYISGSIKDNVLEGTLEDSNNTYIIKYNGENLYTIKKEVETVSEDILNDIDKEYLLPKNIIETINDPKNIGIKSADEKNYKYKLDNGEVDVFLDDTSIIKIIITINEQKYNLEFKEVKNEV